MSYQSLPRCHIPENGIISDYYSKKASTYDSTVRPADRSSDMKCLMAMLEMSFSGKDVLEVACGTGYWTKKIAKSASLVKAVDINRTMIDKAAAKLHGLVNVALEVGDAYSLTNINGLFDIGFGGFWWSHVPRKRQRNFLIALCRRLRIGASLIMVDNNYVKGCSGPITGIDREGNTYQTRTIDGQPYQILKNFPTQDEIQEMFSSFACHTKVVFLKHYWILTCEVQEMKEYAERNKGSVSDLSIRTSSP